MGCDDQRRREAALPASGEGGMRSAPLGELLSDGRSGCSGRLTLQADRRGEGWYEEGPAVGAGRLTAGARPAPASCRSGP